MRDATKAVRYGHKKKLENGAPLHSSPVFASTYYAPGDPDDSPRNYGRSDNPGWRELEEAIAQLEGGPTVVFASGMAAVMAVFGTVLRPGDVAVVPSDGYFFARSLAETWFAEMGVVVRTAPTQGTEEAGALEGAKLLWIETPSNPELMIADIAALVKAAKQRRVTVVVDNTTATPLAQKPLALGADYSVSSDTKAMAGHSDILMGHVSARNARLGDQIRDFRTLTGAIPGPMEAWLALRSLGTLALRLERQSENAQRIAEFLAGHAAVGNVFYPGLKTHPGHELAARQMRYFGGVLSFELKDKEAAERFFAASTLVTECTSFGGLTTTAERRARWGGDAVPEGFIRMSVGCEDCDDLLEDLEQAVSAAGESVRVLESA